MRFQRCDLILCLALVCAGCAPMNYKNEVPTSTSLTTAANGDRVLTLGGTSAAVAATFMPGNILISLGPDNSAFPDISPVDILDQPLKFEGDFQGAAVDRATLVGALAVSIDSPGVDPDASHYFVLTCAQPHSPTEECYRVTSAESVAVTKPTAGSVHLEVPLKESNATFVGVHIADAALIPARYESHKGVPAEVEGVTATLKGTNEIEIAWNAVDSGGIQLAYISGSTPPVDCTTGTVVTSTTIAQATSFSVGNLTSGSWAFRVCSVNQRLPADFSAGATATATVPAVDGGGASKPGGTWRLISKSGAPSSRSGAAAVWNGAGMIVFGGYLLPGGGVTNTGANYNPTSDSWATLPATGAPSARAGMAYATDGAELFVFGGVDGTFSRLKDFNSMLPGTSWTPREIDNTGSRENATGVWTDNTHQFYIFGGTDGLSFFGLDNWVGGIWTAKATTNLPQEGRVGHSLIWTGTKLIMWGGAALINGTWTYFNDGAVFDPIQNTWTTTAPSPLTARARHAAVWTEQKLAIWGGQTGGTFTLPTAAFGDGALYDPTTNTWTTMASSGAPTPRYGHSAVWTGGAMVVYGGFAPSMQPSPRNDGGSFALNGGSGSWSEIAPSPLSGRTSHNAVWTGKEMIIFGGCQCTDAGAFTP